MLLGSHLQSEKRKQDYIYYNIMIKYLPQIRMDCFLFFFKRSFRYENDDEKTKNETFLKITAFKKFVVSLTVVNDNPSLTIVKDDPSLTTTLRQLSLTKRGRERKPTRRESVLIIE